jgi:hypothetical protein
MSVEARATGLEQASPGLSCRTYTHARKHPMVIGKIAGWSPPPVTPTQLGVGVVSFLLLLYTRPLWAHLSWAGNILVQGGLPISLMWATRQLRIEGRPPLRALLGFASYLFSPRGGTLRGRPYREPRPLVLRPRGVFVVETPATRANPSRRR